MRFHVQEFATTFNAWYNVQWTDYNKLEDALEFCKFRHLLHPDIKLRIVKTIITTEYIEVLNEQGRDDQNPN